VKIAAWRADIRRLLLVQLLFCGLGLQQQLFVQPPLGRQAIAWSFGGAGCGSPPDVDYGLR
jgi:hypothetical protein